MLGPEELSIAEQKMEQEKIQWDLRLEGGLRGASGVLPGKTLQEQLPNNLLVLIL